MDDQSPGRRPRRRDNDIDALLRAAYQKAAGEELTPGLRALLDRLREAEAQNQLPRRSGPPASED
jgi:hypothetical protein